MFLSCLIEGYVAASVWNRPVASADLNLSAWKAFTRWLVSGMQQTEQMMIYKKRDTVHNLRMTPLKVAVMRPMSGEDKGRIG